MPLKTILLVEDNPDDVVLTTTALRETDSTNTVVIARDGIEALDYLFCTGRHIDREPIPPHLVLLDLKLPRLDGLEVLKRIKKNYKTSKIPVVVLTTSSEKKDVLDCYSHGANSYVRKPVDFNQFLESTRQLSKYWLEVNVPTNDVT